MDLNACSGRLAFLEATLALMRQLDFDAVSSAILDISCALFQSRTVWLLVHDPDADELVTTRCHGQGAETFAGSCLPCAEGAVGRAFRTHEAVFIPDVAKEWRWFESRRIGSGGLHSVIALPLIIDDEAVGVLVTDNPELSAEHPPTAQDIRWMQAVAAVAAAALRNARLVEHLASESERARRTASERRQQRSEVGQLRQRVRESRAPHHLVGDSLEFRQILDQVDVVAPADTSVLLLGETGTGKELIARAIHDHSRRADRPFIAINCAALPESLVESELFGYEKGAFTGATSKKAGKFELAHLGTIFLDEIGDLPAAAQAKLLRVLQEREILRIGGTRPSRVDVRLVAATNQDLEQCMRDGRFRPDLFYRLSVFPIQLLPLRQRRGDIAALASYFVRRFAEQQHRPVLRIASATLERLRTYEWPGNIRELQNVMERAVILTPGTTIEPGAISLGGCGAQRTRGREAGLSEELPTTRMPDQPAQGANVIRFSDAERHAIVRALERSGWRISGAGGAAESLALKPTTLHAKMKKLGIHRPTHTDSASRSVGS